MKTLAKADSVKIGEVLEGTGPGTRYSAIVVKKVSKSFVLKGGGSFDRHTMINCKAGDTVVFVN